ncbi:MAG: hypothetical protein QXQ57_02360 [Sulfolobales archaeon]
MVLFLYKKPLPSIRIIDRSLITSPYEKPKIFISAVAIILLTIMVAGLRRHYKGRSRGRSASLI